MRDEKKQEKVGENIIFTEYSDPKNLLRRDKRMAMDKENIKTWNEQILHNSFDNRYAYKKMGYMGEQYNDLKKSNIQYTPKIEKSILKNGAASKSLDLNTKPGTGTYSNH